MNKKLLTTVFLTAAALMTSCQEKSKEQPSPYTKEEQETICLFQRFDRLRDKKLAYISAEEYQKIEKISDQAMKDSNIPASSGLTFLFDLAALQNQAEEEALQELKIDRADFARRIEAVQEKHGDIFKLKLEHHAH